jgi:hypothetical protein
MIGSPSRFPKTIFMWPKYKSTDNLYVVKVQKYQGKPKSRVGVSIRRTLAGVPAKPKIFKDGPSFPHTTLVKQAREGSTS